MGTCCGRDDASTRRRLQQLVAIVEQMAAGSEGRAREGVAAVGNLERLRAAEEGRACRCGETCEVIGYLVDEGCRMKTGTLSSSQRRKIS